MIKAAGAKKERETRAIVVKEEGRSHTKAVMKDPLALWLFGTKDFRVDFCGNKESKRSSWAE